MSDQSTREQIRAEAADRIARFAYESDVDGSWDAAPDPDKALVRDWACDLVDALGDLLPTGIEWGVYLDGMAPPNPFRTASESTARSLLDTQDDHVVLKYTHDWIEVTE